MSTSSIEITYAAHTASCTFLLDGEGICRRIVMAPKGKRGATSRTASRCVGAQYVASLDNSAAGGLVEMPRVGAAMLFARVDERGRVSLVRTGVVTRFESNAAHDPFLDSVSVETSAPVIPPSRHSQQDPDYYDTSDNDRTQRIPALREEDIAAALLQIGREHEQGNDLATAEYDAMPDEAARVASHPATIRKIHPAAIIDDDDEDDRRPTLAATPLSPNARGMLPRRSDPHVRAAAAVAWAPPAARPAAQSDVQVMRRRRGG